MEHAFSLWQDGDGERHYLLWSASLSLVCQQGYDGKKNTKSVNFLWSVQPHREDLLSLLIPAYPVCLYRSTTTPCPSLSEKNKTPAVRSEILLHINHRIIHQTMHNRRYSLNRLYRAIESLIIKKMPETVNPIVYHQITQPTTFK